MNTTEFLINRVSYNQLTEPAPNAEQLLSILAAGGSVPDHGNLKPFKFIVFEGDARNDLGEIFAEAAEQDGADCEKIEKALKMTLRAPLIIAIIAKITPDHKIPEIEQTMTAGCAAYAMQMAAVDLGYQGIWRTGQFAYHSYVKQQLNITQKDQIVGFLYIGTAKNEVPVKARQAVQQYVQYW